ncbi:putative integral membrane protein conserved region-domain-containing protein [Syncephalis plumigaleata]|nr:putative integral membrane protein conserved region-domain-containing protein [Syncephalis plumigaleata]
MHDVSIYPPGLPDNEIFLKDTPIRLARRPTPHDDVMEEEEESRDYYLFINAPVEKEDWYFALLKSSRHGSLMDMLNFDTAAMRRVIGQVYSDADADHSVPWLNALLGRLFLSVYKTPELRQHFINKIIKKTKRLRKPDFIDDIKVRDLDVGNQAPHIWDPRLLELSPDGTLRISVRIRYEGGFRVEIETGAIISVSSRVRSIHVPVVLSALVKHFEGRMLVKIKPPPSNRLWIGFFDMPDMDISMEPVVSTKSLKYPVITKAILNRVRDMMRETIVLPNMDDMPFFNTYGTGGIFGSDIRHPPDVVQSEETIIVAEAPSSPSTTTEESTPSEATEKNEETTQESSLSEDNANDHENDHENNTEETLNHSSQDDIESAMNKIIETPQPTNLTTSTTAAALLSTHKVPELHVETPSSDTINSSITSESPTNDNTSKYDDSSKLTASPSLFLAAKKPDGGLAGLSRLMQHASTTPTISASMIRSRSTGNDGSSRPVPTRTTTLANAAAQPSFSIREPTATTATTITNAAAATTATTSSSSSSPSVYTRTQRILTRSPAVSIAAMPITSSSASSWENEETRTAVSTPVSSSTSAGLTNSPKNSSNSSTNSKRKSRILSGLLDTSSYVIDGSGEATGTLRPTELSDTWGHESSAWSTTTH